MKKGNRVLAMFLATVMLFTSIAWDFSNVDAAETESVVTETAHSGLINFVDVDVSTLNDRFSSTQLDSETYAIVGDPDQAVENHWMSTESVTNDSGVVKTIEGIKPKIKRSENKHHLLKYNNTYENFRLSVKITWSTNVGIILGAEHKYPLETATDGIMIYTSGGSLVVRGAIDNQKQTMTLASSIFEKEETLNVRLEDGVLTVWVDNYNNVLTVKTASTYPEQTNISLWSMGYNNTNSFKTFEARNLNTDGYYDFDHVDVSTLESEFTATQYLNSDNSMVGDSEQEVSALWYSGRKATSGDLSLSSATVGMRPLVSATNTYNHLLNYQERYRDFEATIEMYVGSNMGVIIGEETTYPTSATSPAIVLWFVENKIGLKGAIDYVNASVSGENAAWSGSSDSSLFTYSDSNFTNGGVYELNVRMVDGTLTVWVTGYDAVLTVDVTSDYPMGSTVALWGRGYGSTAGSFKSLTVQSLDESYFNFIDADVATLNDGFTSTQLDEANSYAIIEGEQDQPVEKHWSSDITSIPGIKPKTVRNIANDKGYYHLLKYNEAYKNFELSVELRWGVNIGIVLGDAYVYPLADTTNALMISPDTRGSEYKKLRVRGAIDGSTAETVGTLGTTESSGDTTSYFQVSDTSLSNSMQRINIKMEDRVLTISVEGYDEVYTVDVADTYPEGTNVSLWAIGYDNNISFGDFYIKNLDDTYVNFENIDLTDADDQAKINADFTSTRLVNSAPYAIDGEADQAVENHWSTDATLTSNSATVSVPGIKPNIYRTDNPNPRFSLLKYNKAYNNFELSVKLVWGTNIGIVLGDAYTYPLATSTNAIFITPDNANFTRLKIRGAIDQTTATVEGTIAKKETSSNQCLFYVASTVDEIKYQTKTVNIKMENGLLTIWVDGIDEVLTISVSETYPLLESNISLWAYGYDNDISFKSFMIRELKLAGNTGTTVDVEMDGARYTSFDKVDVSVLEEKNFTATRFNSSDGYSLDGEVDQPVSSYWAAGKDVLSDNDGLKSNALQADAKMTILNTPYSYEDFRVSTEVYWGANTGIVLGEKNAFPAGSSSSTSVRIYFNSSQLQLVGGGFDYETAKVTGGTATWNPNSLSTNDVAIFKPASDYTREIGKVYKLNVELIDGIFTIWLDGIEGVLTIKATDTFLATGNQTVALMSRGFDGDCGGLKSLLVEEIQNLTIPYTADEFATYRSVGGHTAPTYKNYLFAGWFTDTSCTPKTAVSSSITTIDAETVYAKFVLRDILTVKAQVSSELVDGDLTNDAEGNIRFVTTVDSLNYSQAGFKVAFDSPTEGPVVKTSASKKVYSSLSAMSGQTYEPTDFCNSSIYFKACTVRGITEEWYDLTFTVTPFWKTLDGTVVTGDTVVKTMNQGMDFEYLSGKSALFLGDSIMKGAEDEPANDFHYLSWAGRLDRYYGMDVDKVAQSGWALTSDCPESSTSTTIRGQIATQLEKASKDSYDYVILEGGCNDVLTYTNGDQTVMNGKWGTIQTADDAVLDDTTIAGAMQDLIVKAHTAYPNAKLVYIINSEYGLFDADQTNIYNNEARLAQMIKDVCMLYKEKGYDINYIDLSNTTVYPELSAISLENADLVSEYLPDKLHPNAASYDLSTPVIASFLRKVGTGKLPEAVYLSSDGNLNDAIDEVVDGGTVYVQGTYAITSNDWVEHGKQVTIASAPDTSATIDLSALTKSLRVEDAVIFDNITLQFSDSTNGGVMARGHALAVNDDVTFTGKSIKIYGGKDGSVDVDSTQLRLYAGNYTEIYGGGSSGNVKYDTNIIIGSKVNASVDPTSHDETSYLLFGGVYNGTVKGNTYITVSEDANFHYIFGGSRDSGGVNGSTNIKFAGNAYGIYGGSWKGTVSDTHVEILGGTVAQVFGGCRETSMTGNTDVQLLGGTITRRVYGGCYNVYNTESILNAYWEAAYYVDGHTNVTIGPNVTLALSDLDSDRGVFAGSRYGDAFNGEIGTVIFVDGSYDSKNGALGSQDTTGKAIIGTPKYNYLVQATTGGTVTAANGLLYVTSDDGYTETVTNITANDDGTYTLSTATDIITVTFATE